MTNATTESSPRDSGPRFKLVVRVFGLVAIGGIFLKFLMDRSVLDMFNIGGEVMAADGFGGLIDVFVTGGTAMATIIKILILIGFIGFPIIGLLMLIMGKYRGHQFTFVLLYNIAAFCMIQFFGDQAGVDGNFFVNTGIGYWISNAALFVPMIAMFFLDESV